MKIIVNENDKLVRIDSFLSEKLDETRSQIVKLIDSDSVNVNGKKVKASYKVEVNDQINIIIKEVNNDDLVKQDIPLDIIYEDDYLMVINKQSGLVVHPGNGNVDNTLVNGLLFYTDNLSSVNGDIRPGIVHRIDKDTSGLLIVAKNDKTHNKLAKMLSSKKIKREYLALLIGEFKHESATIDAPIGRDALHRKRMTVTASNSKSAVTNLKVIKKYKGHTLVKLKLETGRTHQIRVHMKYIGFPIYNDPLYTTNNTSSFGQFLHSANLEFVHPETKEKLTLSCELPKEFQDYLNNLEEL